MFRVRALGHRDRLGHVGCRGDYGTKSFLMAPASRPSFEQQNVCVNVYMSVYVCVPFQGSA